MYFGYSCHLDGQSSHIQPSTTSICSVRVIFLPWGLVHCTSVVKLFVTVGSSRQHSLVVFPLRVFVQCDTHRRCTCGVVVVHVSCSRWKLIDAVTAYGSQYLPAYTKQEQATPFISSYMEQPTVYLNLAFVSLVFNIYEWICIYPIAHIVRSNVFITQYYVRFVMG